MTRDAVDLVGAPMLMQGSPENVADKTTYLGKQDAAKGLAKFHAVSVGLRWVVVHRGLAARVAAGYWATGSKPCGCVPVHPAVRAPDGTDLSRRGQPVA